jgi:hypothetical protein
LRWLAVDATYRSTLMIVVQVTYTFIELELMGTLGAVYW